MFINGILRNIEIVMDQSATIASLSKYFTVLDKWLASSVSNDRFANASIISTAYLAEWVALCSRTEITIRL